MVSGPPCPQCGMPLRWFPEQNAWGCDRCRQMFPAQMQPQMQPQMPMQPQMHGQMPPPAKKGAGLKIAIAGVVVIGAIVTIVVVATRGGGSDDRHELVLANLKAERKAICECQNSECITAALHEYGDFQEKLRDGVKLTKDELKQSDEIFAGIKECIDKVPGTDLPPAQAGVVDEMLREGRQLRDRMCACADKACAASVIGDSQKWLAKYKPGFDALPRSTREAAMAFAEAEKKCYDAVGQGAGTPAQPARGQESEPSDDSPPEECADWKAEIDRMEACGDFPKASAKTLKDAYVQLAATWRKAPRAQVVELCKAGAESLHNAVNAVCPE